MERRLAAILAADLAGYSRLMGENEEGTHKRFHWLRHNIIEPLISGHRGRLVKLTGDGLLVEFQSVVDAVKCAAAWQQQISDCEQGRELDQQFLFRIGINLGDIIFDNNDIYGDGVNIAARLETFADPGGIAVSAIVHQNVKSKVELVFEDLGERAMKNIREPVHIYRIVRLKDEALAKETLRATLTLPDKPSLAVLPFENLSGDREQDYFADGMVEEIITALSRLRWLFVIARNSSFTYKGRAVDVKQVGRDLGVRYVLEGSVRKAGNRVRIAGQLLDTSNGAHLWADRFDGELKDIFDLQDQVTSNVVGAIAPKLEQAEIERSKRKPTENLDAYDYFLRGMAAFHKWTREANIEALSLFYRAIDRDESFASAYGMAARCYSQRKTSGWVDNRSEEIAETARLARRTVEVGKDDALALCTAGISLVYVVGERDGAALIERALVLNPNLAWAWLFSGWVKLWLGEPEAAIERVNHALRLSPQDPHIFSMQSAIACAHFFASRYSEAYRWAEAAVREQPNMLLATCVAAASAALADRQTEAKKAIAKVRALDPELRISNLANLFPIEPSQQNLARWADGLRKAGLQDN
jgi:TolB-like protein/class 3 adenylate cyclase